MIRNFQDLVDQASKLIAEKTVTEPNTQTFQVYYAKTPQPLRANTNITYRQIRTDYVKLADVEATKVSDVFMKMQGEQWSPNKEAEGIIRSLGLSHVSMTVGDIIKTPTLEYFMITNDGFDKLVFNQRTAMEAKRPCDT